MNTYVYIGLTMPDAQSLAMTRRERDKGHRVVLLTATSTPQSIEGLRVTAYEVTPRAKGRARHLEEILERSVVKSAYRG